MDLGNNTDPNCAIILSPIKKSYSIWLRAFVESVPHQLATKTTKKLKTNERTAIMSNNGEHMFQEFIREDFITHN